MNKRSKLVSAMALGLVGFLALGACSSGSDQAEANREAAPESAAASPTGEVLKASAKGNFKDVTVTHSGPSRCSTKDLGDKLEISCQNVEQNFAGDQVFVRVPTHNFRINVNKYEFSSNQGRMLTVQRDGFYVEADRSEDDDVTWSAPPSHLNAWGVGIEGIDTPINMTVTVTKV